MCIQLDFSSLLCFQSMLIPGYPNHDHCKYSMDFLWMREPLSRPFSQVLSLTLNVLFKLKPSASSEPSPVPPFLSRLNLTITQVEWFSLILSTPLLPHSDSVLSFAIQSPSGVWLFATPWLQHSRLLCPPLSPGVCSNSCPWVGDTIYIPNKMDNQQGPAVWHKELCSVLCGRWERGLGGNGYIFMYGWVPLLPHETITALLIGCIPI